MFVKIVLRDFLSFEASSVDSDSKFSISGNITSGNWGSLSDDSSKYLLLLKSRTGFI